MVMVRLTRRLYQRVIADLAALSRLEGKMLDVGTGPGTFVREIARRLPGLQVYGIDLSEDMIGLARAHASREHLEGRVHFASGDVAHLPYPDQSFDVVVSTISMHHWAELVQPLRELYRVLRPGGRSGSMTSASLKRRPWRRRSPVRLLRKPRSRMGLCEREEARSRSTSVLPCRRRISTKTNTARRGQLRSGER